MEREIASVKVISAVQCQDAHFERTESDLLGLPDSPYFEAMTLDYEIRLDDEIRVVTICLSLNKPYFNILYVKMIILPTEFTQYIYI